MEHDERPWGEYWVLDDAAGHKVKRIEVRPGKRLSLQKHSRRAEHWIVVAGTAEVTLDDTIKVVEVGGAVEVPIGTVHRVANDGSDPLVLIEVQYGTYFGEDDIERFEDDFGRA